jgi:hypothetical protein
VRVLAKIAGLCLVVAMATGLSGCSDPQVYGSIGISSGYGGHYGGRGPHVNTSFSVGGRIF